MIIGTSKFIWDMGGLLMPFDLFPQHCLLPKFTPKQHANEVHDELMDAIQKLEAPAKKLILTKLAAALQSLAASTAPQPIQRVAEPDPKEERSIQRVNQSPTITTSTNPTAPRTLKAKPHTHLRKTRANTPKMVPPIVNPMPLPTGVRRSPRAKANVIEPIYTATFSPLSNRMSICSPNMISQEAVNFISEKVYNEDPTTWMP